MYFLIHCSEDGNISIDPYEKEELEKSISGEEYGDIGYFEELTECDPQYWGNNVLIIKGEIVTPKIVKVVEKYEL